MGAFGRTLMTFVKLSAVAAAALLFSGMASAADEIKLAEKSGCLACHAVDHKIIGPAYKDVAAKYKGDAGAAKRLYEKVAKGGSGVWGTMAMPPNSHVAEGDIHKLVDWVLSLK